ncbi:predicted protein [Chaetoceros tenuissimus]|uniref:Uncharacterized protein n=1 Tax=Chaetoceros tenuissimus TaxID=426638 RepID=A0AAD3D9A9_9STRA|nr:predicted protein [Chaetoceros tenuissimus]
MHFSTLKRTQPCLDFISMNSSSSEHDCSCGITPSASSEGRKRCAGECGWDHYKSEDDDSEYLELREYQTWRNKKRERGPEIHIKLRPATRLKIAIFNGDVPVIAEEHLGSEDCSGKAQRGNDSIPSTIFCRSRKRRNKTEQSLQPRSPVSEITHHLDKIW